MKIEVYLKASPVVSLNAVYESVITDFNRKLKAEGVNLTQGLILTALFFENSETVTPSLLAETFQTSRANISHSISHLEANGWVRRAVDPDDARKMHIQLKPEGRKLATRLVKKYDEIQNEIEKQMGSSKSRRVVDGLLELNAVYARVYKS